MRNRLLLASAMLALCAASNVQAQQPKPVSRADYVKRLDNRFNGIDANHDGKISKEELTAEQQREMQQAKAKIAQQLQTKFRQLDTNKDGQLSLQEFMAIQPPLRSSETPEQMLARLDSNRDGKISVDEYRAPDLAKFNRIDANHDGIVSPDEIKAATGRK